MMEVKMTLVTLFLLFSLGRCEGDERPAWTGRDPRDLMLSLSRSGRLPSEHCVDLVLALADRIGEHGRCLAANASPAGYCIQCQPSLRQFQQAFDSLVQPSEYTTKDGSKANASCVDECAPVDDEGYTLTMIAMYYRDQIVGEQSLFNKGNCHLCFESNGTVLPYVRDTLETNARTMACFDQFRDGDTYLKLNKSQCDVCRDEYLSLREYASKYFYGFTSCADAKTAVYITTKIWVSDFGCGGRIELPYYHYVFFPILVSLYVIWFLHPFLLGYFGYKMPSPYNIVIDHHGYDSSVRDRLQELQEECVGNKHEENKDQ